MAGACHSVQHWSGAPIRSTNSACSGTIRIERRARARTRDWGRVANTPALRNSSVAAFGAVLPRRQKQMSVGQKFTVALKVGAFTKSAHLQPNFTKPPHGLQKKVSNKRGIFGVHSSDMCLTLRTCS